MKHNLLIVYFFGGQQITLKTYFVLVVVYIGSPVNTRVKNESREHVIHYL